MIFGEYLGEVVSNGEYEVRAQGTTLAGLQAAVDALTMGEYYDSFITLDNNSSLYSGNDLIFYPYNSGVKVYIQNLNHISGTGVVSVTTYYFLGNVYETTKTIISSGSLQRTQKDTSAGTLTISAWKLYTRKQTLAIPGASNKIFKKKGISVGNVTLSNAGWYEITSLLPTTPDGYELYDVKIKQFNGNLVPIFNIYIENSTQHVYVWGSANQSISALEVWAYYIKSDSVEIMS